MGVFHVFKIVQMVPNRTMHHIWYLQTFQMSDNTFELVLT